MEKLLLFLSHYLRDIKQIHFGVLFILSSSLGFAQSITTNKTVTANTTNCGIVNVKVDITGANPITRNSDVILAIDISGSMGNTIAGDFKTSMDYAKDAALAFLTQAKTNPQNRIAIVAYSTTASLKIGLTYLNTAGVTAITAQINALQATNSTNIYGGIVRSETELETNGRFDCSTARAIILLTDGVTNVTGTSGNTNCNVSKTSQCVTDAINAATNAKTTTKSSVVYNNQLFSVGLFGGLSGNINTNNSEQNIAKYTLDAIQGSASYITQSGANLTSIYNQIATQISWVAQSLITKETIIPGFTIGSITTSKGTASLSGQVITWNTDFLNSETITLNYQLTPTGTACGNQIVSTSTLNYQNSSCAADSKAINTSSYFVPCAPVITGLLTACGSTTLTATTNAASPTYVWYKDNVVLTGQTSVTLVATVSGVYKVAVKNGATNCELTSADSTVSVSPAPALTAPANASISGCGTSGITGLPYSTASTNITLAQLTTAGGTLSNSALLGTYTISYSDVASGTCPTVVTRTFKVTTGCGNVTAPQTISITDTTAPTWTTSATALNTTLQCSDTAGLTAAQSQTPVATDNCGGTVTYTKTSGAFAAGSCANSGTYTNTWIAKDVCLNTSTTFTQVITIQDTTAPTWTTSATALNTTLQCSDTARLTAAQNQAPVATDNCGGTVTYTKTSGTFTAGSCANSGTYTNTWIAKDVCLNTSTTFTQVITIQDTTAPTWTTSANALNTTLQCSDTAGLTAAQSQTPVATDNCGGTVTYTKTSGAFAAGSCANSGTYTNTWIAKDVCLNTSTTFTQVITIQDTTAPTWTTTATALNTTLQCSDTAGLTTAQNQAPVATDNCGGTVTYTKTSGTFAAGSCANSGTYTNTWIAKDVCLNTSTTFTQVITIQDTTSPTWTTTATALNTTLQCSDTAGLTAAQSQTPAATDNCGGTVTYTKTSGTFVAGSCANSGMYTNTWIAKDACLNASTTFTQVITIQDTTAPTWTTPITSLNKTIECSDSAALTSAQALFPTASDSCDADVSNIVKVSGAFVASANCANAGTYTNTWTVKDDCGNISDTYTQVITIQDTTAPSWTTPIASLNKIIECSDSAALTSAQALFPTASDSCDADVSNIVKVSGAFVASASCANAGTYTNTWTVKDDCGNVSNTFTQVITIQDTTAPSWTTTATALNTTLQCSDTAGLTTAQNQAPVATDNCGGTVTYTKTSGTFAAGSCANSGTYTNTWIAKDVCLNTSTTFTQVITIQDTTAPSWTTPIASLNKTIQCSDSAALTSAQALFPTASDSCDANVSNIVKVSGAFVASANCANAGTYTNTWTVIDDCGNVSDTFTQVITIQDNTAPSWTTPITSLNKTIECSDSAALTSAQALFPTASDSCDADVSNIVKVSSAFVASANCANAGTYTNTWTVKDDCGNVSDTFKQVITLEDTTKPVFTGNLPLDSTVSCDAVPEPATMEVSDNCNNNLPVVFHETKSNIENECATNYTLTRTWTTSDCGGNTASYTQIITVRDNTPPTGTAPLDIANLSSIADIPVGSSADIKDAADNCSTTVNITVSDSTNEGSGCEGNPYILTRTYTLTDCAGNKTVLKQTFTVENKVSVSGIAYNVTCLGGKDGAILVTNSPGSTVIITNQNNEVVGNTNLSAGTYTLTATSPVNSGNVTCSATATVIITQPVYTVKISGQIINKDTHTPIANVPVTLVPQGTTTGPVLLRITGADGLYSFSGMVAGSYLVQVQDANLNSVRQLFPIDSSLFFTTLEDCKIQQHDFEYGASTLPVLGDYVWYDTNSNGIQDEWFDANNDGVVTKNIPDGNGVIDFTKWEWIDLNGDGSYTGPANVGELNAGGFGNALSPNIIIDGPNGYHNEVIVGIEGYWRNRPATANPFGAYTIKLVKDANFDTAAATLGATGLVKVLPSVTDKKTTTKTAKTQLHTVCSTTEGAAGYIVTVTPEDLIHLDADFGVNCKTYSDIVANDDTAGPIAGVNHTTPNVLNVLKNDTLEGAPLTSSEVIITTVTPNPFLQLNSDGSVDVLANAPVGTLTLVYQICEADQTTNCDTATVTVTIEAPVMTVTATAICVNDVPYVDYVVTPVNFTPVNGVTIAWANTNNTVITTMNDLPLSGRVLWPGAVVDQAGKGIDWPGWIFQNNTWIQGADGFETLRPTVKLIISVNPSDTITVNYPPADPYCTSRPTFAIVANDDTAGPVLGTTGQINIINVLTNDTLNNSAVLLNDVTLTVVTPYPKGALTLNPNGSIDVAAGTPAGTYTLTYQICEKADFGNCDTAIVTIIVSAPTPVVATDDVYANIGCNTFGLVGNVLSNDLKGAAKATLELVNFTLLSADNGTKTDPNISFDASGNVTVTNLTPAGTYTYNYQICDKLSADNCDTAMVTITVVPNGVTTITSEACSDDATPINLLSLLPEGTPATGTWTDQNNSNALSGNNFNPLGLALGHYILEYKITDQNCPRSILLNMEINGDCKVLACGTVLVHNAFSPNGDGINDLFKIDNIDETTCYPENNVEIYNRWGILVFETDNYNNTTNAFDGNSRGRTTIKQSDGLPAGTYFYIITYKSLDGNNVTQTNKKEGYLYLSR